MCAERVFSPITGTPPVREATLNSGVRGLLPTDLTKCVASVFSARTGVRFDWVAAIEIRAGGSNQCDAEAEGLVA